MQEMHGVIPNIAAKVQKVVCKLWAQLISSNQLSQNVLGWLVEHEPSAPYIILFEKKDDCLRDMHSDLQKRHCGKATVSFGLTASDGVCWILIGLPLSVFAHIMEDSLAPYCL